MRVQISRFELAFSTKKYCDNYICDIGARIFVVGDFVFSTVARSNVSDVFVVVMLPSSLLLSLSPDVVTLHLIADAPYATAALVRCFHRFPRLSCSTKSQRSDTLRFGSAA